MNYYNNKQVSPERTFERDHWPSMKHREYGVGVAGTDLDFFFMEYDYEKLIALMEYKHFNAQINLNHFSLKNQGTLATNSNIPFIIVVYYPDECVYYLIAGNEIASKIPWLDQPRFWNEANFVRLLYWMRKKPVPQDILDKARKTIPKDLPLPKLL